MEKISFVKACQDFFMTPPHDKKSLHPRVQGTDSGRQGRAPRDADRGRVGRRRTYARRSLGLTQELTERDSPSELWQPQEGMVGRTDPPKPHPATRYPNPGP